MRPLQACTSCGQCCAPALNLLDLPGESCIHLLAMSISNTVGPADAPWDTPDPVTCIRQLQSLVGLGFNVGHDSAGNLQTLIQSAMGGIRKEVDQHMDYMGTEHVEHKTDHQLQRKMVRFWKRTMVTIHENQVFEAGDNVPESDHVYYQWNKMRNLPGWWIKKVWQSYDGWLLVAKKEEFSLLIFDVPPVIDQSQRQTLVADMSKRALQTFLHLPEDSLVTRPRSRSPRGNRNSVASASASAAQNPVPIVNAEAPQQAPVQQVQAQVPAPSEDAEGDDTMPMAM